MATPMSKRRHVEAAEPADRLRQIELEVARDLNCEIGDELCQHVSVLRLLRLNMQAAMLNGQRVDPDDLLKIDSALKSYLPVGKPATIKVEVAQTITGICPACHAKIPNYKAPPEPPANPKPAIEPEPTPAPAAKSSVPAVPRRPMPVHASAVSPMSYTSGFDPVRHYDSPQSRDPNPYRKDTSR